jgi:hypothetical protein
MAERFANEQMAAELSRIKIMGPEAIEAWYVCDETELAQSLGPATLNTDDNMHIENRTPREAFLPLMQENATWIEALATRARASRAVARR